ncbi:MAG: quinolinate synthase NadA [candidate division Zixibacteria bacterium]|nr:quinolinate synthase NadA [Candidatus Tariuqbacter arcticus]
MGNELKSSVNVIPDIEEYKKLPHEELNRRINRAKKLKNVVLLVHNYQRLEIQEHADLLGDSLGLSIEASKTDASLIVFCGVDFMAESAKILNPEKKVVLPHDRADCPMAKMVDLEGLRALKKKHPHALVVTYVNSTAEVKAESDICCTSANAVEVVRSLGDKKIIFTPDRNLAIYTQRMTGANIIPWEGYCYVHDSLSEREVELAQAEYPDAVFIAHPECPMEVLEKADLITSTSGMVKWVDENQDTVNSRGVIIGTEEGLVRQLQKKYPQGKIFPLFDKAICATQKLITLPYLCRAIEIEQFEIEVPQDTRKKAYLALKRMIDILPQD